MKTAQSRTATMPGIFGVLGFTPRPQGLLVWVRVRQFIMGYLRKRLYLAAFLCTGITQVFTNNLTNILRAKTL